MLKLVLGTSGSGKTTLLYARIRARAEAGKRSILLVPEQFTSSTEARIYRELGDALSGMVESYSFTSLAEHILAIEGGAAVQTLTDAGRAVLVRRALEELQDNVHYYYRHRRSAAFCQMAAETIDELKSAGLSGAQLAELAPDCGPETVAEAIVTTIVEKALKSTEKKAVVKLNSADGTALEVSKTPFSAKLGWLNKLLWGGSALLAFEHVWHGEIVPFFPFLTAVKSGETGEMLAEMGSAGVMMAVTVTAVWVGMLAVSRFAEKKSLKSPADLLGGMQR